MMAIDEKAADEARRLAALRDAALALLLERAGGQIEFTEAEYQAVLVKYGGPMLFNIRLEVLRQAGQPDRVQARLERKPPAQGSLPV
jgi:hypothetical protein